MSFQDFLKKNKVKGFNTDEEDNSFNGGFSGFLKENANDLYKEHISDVDDESIKERYEKWYGGLQSFSTSSSSAFDDKWHDSSYFSSYSQNATSLLNEGSKIYEYLRDSGDAETVSSFQEALDQLREYKSGIEEVSKYYSQWDSEEAFGEWKTWQEDQEKKKAFDTTAGQKEIEELEALLKQAEEWESGKTSSTPTTTGMPSATVVPAAGGVDSRNQNPTNTERQNPYLQKYGFGNLSEMKEAIANKRVYLREAQELQTLMGLQETAKADSEFDKWASQGAAIENPEYGTEHGFFGIGAQEVNNRVTYEREGYETWKKAYDSGNTDTRHLSTFMSEDEVSVWNYYLAQDKANGTNRANEFYEALTPTLEARKAHGISEERNDNIVDAALFSLSTGVEGFFANVANNFSGEDYIRPTVNQMAQSMIRQEYEDDGNWLATTTLDLASTTGNMLPAILASYATAGAASGVGLSAGVAGILGKGAMSLSMGVSASGAGYAEMLNLGYSKDQARAYGAMVGIAETATSYLLGSIGGGGKGADGILSGITKKALSKIDNAAARVAIQYAGTVGSEWIEESAQAWMEPWLKSVATGVDFEAAGIDEILYSGLLGALSAGVLEGPGIVRSGVKTYIQGKNVQNVDGGVQKLQQIGNTFSADTVAYKLANKIDENTGAYTIGRLFQEVGATISEQNVADIVAGLEAKGVANDAATKIARKYQAYVNGDTALSQAGKELLEKYTDLGSVLQSNIIRANLTENQKIELRSEGTVKQRIDQRNADLYALANEVANGGRASQDAQKSPQSDISANPNPNSPAKKNTAMGEKTSTTAYDTTGFALLSNEEVQRRVREDAGFRQAYVSWKEKANAKTVEKSIANRTVAPKAEQISEIGKTVNASTGEAVRISKDTPIEKVETVNGDRVVYYNTDKGVVSSKDIRYADKGDALVYEAFADMNPLYANEVIKAYDKDLLKKYGISPEAFVSGMSMGIDIYGKYNFQEVGKDIATGTTFADLPKEMQTIALNIGRMAAKAQTTREATTLKRAMEQAKADVDATRNKKGVVGFENGARAGKAHKKIVKLAKIIARATGANVIFYDSTIPGTREANSNGWYDPKTRTIHLDLQNNWNDRKTIAYTFGHELGHFVKDLSPEKYKAFADFLFEQYGVHGVPTQELLEQKMAQLGTNDIDLAYDELVADACERMLLDSNAVEKLALLNQKDAGLVQKIKTFISNLISKIKAEYAKYHPASDEAMYLSKMEDVIGKFYEMFEDMLVDAAQTNQVLQSLDTASVSVSADGTVQLQMKQYRQTGRSTLLNYLTQAYGKSDADYLISTIDNIYDTMVEVRKDEALTVFSNWQETEIELDEYGHPIFTTSINNGDYELNQDFSRVCKKRRQLDFVLNMLAEDPAFEASHLTKDDFVKINKAIKEHGFEIACALCFVDSKRFRQAEWADSFANTWNDILNSVVTDKSKLTPFNFATKTPNLSDEGIEIDTKKSVMYRKWSDGREVAKDRRNYKSLDELLSKEIGEDGKSKYVEGNANVRLIAELIRDNPNLRHTFRGADIIASQGFDSIQRLAPKIRGILDGWGGSSVPKPSSNDASYDSSIINNKGYNKETAYAMGGVRMNSFSDFMAHMFFDYCQAFADLSAKELPSQAYTKELTYVRLFGRSGQKINMSGIAAIREDALPMKEGKGVDKKQVEANMEIEKKVAGLDPSRLLEYLNKSIEDLTVEEIEQHLDMLDYVWADESINMKNATLLQTGILYDKLSESKVEECYELLKAGEIEKALKAAGEANVDREYAKHCGTIVVGVSDAHIRKLLRDSTVRMVIPYHKSGLNPTIARELRIAAYNDYTKVQTTGVVKGKERKGIASTEVKDTFGLKDFAFYDWFGKTIDGKVYDGKATAEKYLEWCENGYFDEKVGDYVYYTTKGDGYILASEFHKKAKIVPKFDAFSDEANYYKVLEDFDTYDTITGEHSAQGAVDFLGMGLPSDYKDVITKALKDEQATSDAFRDHLDNKGLKDEIMNIVKKRGYQPSDLTATMENIVDAVGEENVGEATELLTDVQNTTRIKRQKKNTSDNTYENIGKGLLYYEEGSLAPDLTLVETINERTGKKEVTIKHYGQKPKGYVPKKIAYCYKLFEQHPDGTLHALFAGAKGATPIGEWQYAQGFPYTDSGVKGMNLRERYGWHLSAGLPSAPHLMSSKEFERGYPSKNAFGHPKGSKRVWVRMAYDATTDFNSIADSTRAGDIFGLVPFGGYYAFKENNQSEWVISSAVKIDKILTEEERQQILKDAGYDEYEAWRKKHNPSPEEKAERDRSKRIPKAERDAQLLESSRKMREAIKSRIIENPELKDGIKRQAKVSLMSNSVFTEDEMLNIRRDVVKRFNLKGINGFAQVQRNVLNTLRANGFFDINGERKVVISENGMEVTINRGSIEETFGSGSKYEAIPAAFKILKLATIEQIPSIIENADVVVENEENRYKNGKNKAFTYLRGTATIEGKSVAVRVTLKISKEKNRFWVHHVDVTKNADDTFGLGAKNASPTDTKLSSAGDSVTQNDPSVNSQNQKKQLSARSILANALESTVDTSTQQGRNELIMLKRYQENVGKVDELEAQLREVKAEIYRLSFSKGAKDRARLAKLYDERTKLTNRINLLDKKLLDIEASKPLKDLLTREKEKARKLGVEKGRQSLVNYKEGRQKTELRNKIKTFKKKLEQNLLRPTERQYVPAGLAQAMVDVLDLIDIDTDLYKADGTINKAQEKRNLTKEKLQALKEEYEKLKDYEDPIYSGEFDDAIYAMLKDLRTRYEGRSLKEMDVDELYDMYDILRSIEETLADARKLIGKGEAADVYEAGYAIIGEQSVIAQKRKGGKRSGAAKAKDSVINLSLSPIRNIERMSGYKEDSALVDLFNDFEIGVRTKNRFAMDAYKDFEAITTGKNAKEYESAIYDDYKGKKYIDEKGRQFSVSKMQMMQAILSQDREKANKMTHIENGGLNFADLGMLRKGRLKDAISNENSHRVSNATAMVEGFREELREDKWAQEYMAAARNFFDGKAKDAVNETMLALKHRIVAKDKSYIPFEVDKNFIVREISAANDIQQTINSYGMLQDTKSKAPQPLIMTGLNNVIDRHIDQVATIAGLAIPVRNFNKVWNVHSVEGVDTTVNNAVEENWGKEGKKLIEQVVQDIQGPRQNNQSELYKKVKSGYIGATFLLNGSVVTKQIGSLFSATSMIRWRDPVRMVGNLLYTMANFKKIAAEVDKYTASAWMRRQGMSDAEVYTLLTEGKKSKITRTLNKLPAPLNPSKWITAMDSAVALSLWKYCKADVKKAHPELEGEALNRATAAFYDTVIENTQSMTDVLHRPEIQKRNDIVSETFGMFKTDLYQMAGQLQNTVGKFNANKSKKNAKALGRTVYSIAASAVWGQLMTTVFALLRYKVNQYRDDEDELTVESWLKRQGFAFGGDMAGYVLPLFGSEIVGTVENIVYGESEDIADSLALTAINDLYSSIVNMASTIKDGEAPTADQYKKLAIKGLQVFGIPANNILRTVEAVQLHAQDIANGEFFSFEAGVERSATKQINRIVDAYSSGEISKARNMFEDAVEELAERKAKDGEVGEDELNAARSQLKSELGSIYRDGEIDKRTAQDALSDLFGESEDDIYWLFDKWDYTIENGDSDDYEKYGGFIEAVSSGVNLRATIKEYTDNGVSEKTLASQITKHYKPLYLEMSKSERARLKGYLLNAYVLLGYDRSKKSKDIDKWLE